MTNFRRRKRKPKVQGRQIVSNNRIKSDAVRVISESGEMIGVLDLQEAIAKAKDEEMDIVEINPKADPPVVKMIALSKFKYLQSKTEKKTKSPEIKTLRVSVRISDHDLQVQSRKADKFLEKNQKVKLQVRMRGRERSHPEVAKETMDRFLEFITEEYNLEAAPKLVGDTCLATVKSK